MSSYLSNILTQTTSKYNSLKRTLLTNEDDGDTEDDSHISRVLRAYYAEKGRPLPPWLPPDPNDRRAITPQPFVHQNSGYFSNSGGKSQVTAVQNQGGGPRNSLSDLWDAPSAQNNAPMQPQSLRAGRRPMAATQASSSTLAPPQARPLPSQRAGSYQTMQPQQAARPAAQPSPPSSSGGISAQERLKARLRGGGSRPASPRLASVANPYDQPPTGANAPYARDTGNPYNDRGGMGRNYGRG